MRPYDIKYLSADNTLFPKPITAFVIEPDSIGPQTGLMLFTHGWGSNRYRHQDRMEYTCETYNLVCVSVEYRQSGYDFDPAKGIGAYSHCNANIITWK